MSNPSKEKKTLDFYFKNFKQMFLELEPIHPRFWGWFQLQV